jgi:hypothetical protein
LYQCLADSACIETVMQRVQFLVVCAILGTALRLFMGKTFS